MSHRLRGSSAALLFQVFFSCPCPIYFFLLLHLTTFVFHVERGTRVLQFNFPFKKFKLQFLRLTKIVGRVCFFGYRTTGEEGAVVAKILHCVDAVLVRTEPPSGLSAEPNCLGCATLSRISKGGRAHNEVLEHFYWEHCFESYKNPLLFNPEQGTVWKVQRSAVSSKYSISQLRAQECRAATQKLPEAAVNFFLSCFGVVM